MVVVDSGVWIDFFRGSPGPACDALKRLLYEGDARIVVPDLVLFEVLRGFRHERDHRQAQSLMASFDIEPCTSPELAVAASNHYRSLRASGVTIRSALDVLIAAFCIDRDYLLLHADRDFEALAAHRGLRVWAH